MFKLFEIILLTSAASLFCFTTNLIFSFCQIFDVWQLRLKVFEVGQFRFQIFRDLHRESLEGVEDRPVSGASAKVAVQDVLDVLDGGLRIALKQTENRKYTI